MNSLHQKATYWASKGDNKYNEEVYDIPVLINCRWEERNELVRAPSGDDITSRARVFMDRRVTIGGKLVLGDKTAYVDPNEVEGAETIQVYNEIPDLRNADQLRKAYL